MKVNEKDILRFLESLDTNFIIPIYQRAYSWSIEEVKKLYDDLIFCAKNNFKTHFFGSIVTVYNDKSKKREYIIIDGQQRITSISLLLIAIYKILMQNKKSTTENLHKKIINQYIINQYDDSDYKLKLILSKRDSELYKKILYYDKDEIDELKNLSINYSYLYNRILKSEISIENLFKAISCLRIVEIELNSSDESPNIIFDSLNSTGITLSIADKIKNYIFMGLNEKMQKNLYNKYYIDIENNVNNNFDEFIFLYLTVKEKRVIEYRKLYESFKLYIEYNSIQMESLINDLFEFSKYYSNSNGNNLDSDIKDIITDISKINKSSSKIFLLILFDDFSNNKITKNQIINILTIFESYLFRRFICRASNNLLNKALLNIGLELKDSSEKIELFKYLLLKQTDNLRFPRNIEFKRCFIEYEMYRLNHEKKIYILKRLENLNNNERVDIEKLVLKNILQIEHIIPRALTESWKIDLGVNYKEIHNKYLHTIGNLTLTGYNQKLSNKSFEEKRDMICGFKESRLKLNKYISKRKKFTEKELIERSILLFEDALKIWPIIQTSIKPKLKEKKLVYLSENLNLNNYIVNSFIFEGKSYNANSFKEVFDKMITILYEIEPLGIKLLCKNSIKLETVAFKLSDTNEMLINAYKIIENVYCDKNIDNNARIDILKLMFSIYKLNLDELSYYIIEKKGLYQNSPS